MAGDLDLLIGKWTVRVKGWTWEYEFKTGGHVTWRDLHSPEKGSGGWAATSKLVNMWWQGSTTRESWRRPLSTRNDHTWYEAPYYRGKYQIEKAGSVAPTPPGPTPPTPPAPNPTTLRAWNFTLVLKTNIKSVFSFRLELTDPASGQKENFLTAIIKFDNTLGTPVNCLQFGNLQFSRNVSLDDILGCGAAVLLKPTSDGAHLAGTMAVFEEKKNIRSLVAVTGEAQGKPSGSGQLYVASELQKTALE